MVRVGVSSYLKSINEVSMDMRDELEESEKLLLARILIEQGPEALDKWLNSLPSQPTDECVIKLIASLHPRYNLFTLLVKFKDPDVRPTINLVLEATRNIDSCDMSDIINLFRFAHTLEPAFLFQVEQSLAQTLKGNVSLMQSVLDELKKANLISATACLLWAGMYVRFAEEEALDFLCTASREMEGDYLIRVALYLSIPENLRINSKNYKKIVEEIIPDVKQLISEYPDLYAAWRALCLASEFSEDAALTLKTIPSSTNRLALTTLLGWIAEKGTPGITLLQIPINELLLPISKIALSDEHIKYPFDVTISQLVRRKAAIAEVWKVFRYFLSEDVDIPNSFKLIMQALSSDRELFAKVFSDWLMSAEANFHAVRAMISGCVAGEYPCKIDSVIFQEADSAKRRRAAMHLLAWTHNAPCLMKFAEDLAEDPLKQPDGLGLADSIIMHLVVEYPMSSAEWLESKVAVRGNETFNKLYQHHRAQAVAYRDKLNQLPVIAELAPTSQQQLAMRQRDVRNRRQIGDIARKKSIFGEMATRVNVMQGKRFATVMPDGSINISDMAEFSFSIEMPVSERADPVGALINRLDYLTSAQ